MARWFVKPSIARADLVHRLPPLGLSLVHGSQLTPWIIVEGPTAEGLRPFADAIQPDVPVRAIEPAEIARPGLFHGPALLETVKFTGATKVHADLRFCGRDKRIAIIDTGVDRTHDMIEGRVITERSFVDGEDAKDLNGHGTWCATAAAGGYFVDAMDREYLGVAPCASIVNAKALNRDGEGTFADAFRALEWASTHADVLSNSWGAAIDVPLDAVRQDVVPVDSALRDLLRAIVARGVVVVFASGNQGPGNFAPPGCWPEVIRVGAHGVRDYRCAEFTSRGPHPTYGTVPDLLAPGGTLLESIWGGHAPPPPDSRMRALAGTSMACPHVAGAAVLLLEKKVPADKIKSALTGVKRRLSTAVLKTDVARAVAADSYPVLDVAEACGLAPTPTPIKVG